MHSCGRWSRPCLHGLLLASPGTLCAACSRQAELAVACVHPTWRRTVHALRCLLLSVVLGCPVVPAGLRDGRRGGEGGPAQAQPQRHQVPQDAARRCVWCGGWGVCWGGGGAGRHAQQRLSWARRRWHGHAGAALVAHMIPQTTVRQRVAAPLPGGRLRLHLHQAAADCVCACAPRLQARTSRSGLPSSLWWLCCGRRSLRRQPPAAATAAERRPNCFRAASWLALLSPSCLCSTVPGTLLFPCPRPPPPPSAAPPNLALCLPFRYRSPVPHYHACLAIHPSFLTPIPCSLGSSAAALNKLNLRYWWLCGRLGSVPWTAAPDAFYLEADGCQGLRFDLK